MKFKNTFIYILLSFVILSIVFPVFSLAFDTDNIYVWSNFSSTSTSITPIEEQQNSENTNLTRKFPRYYFWKCNSNGSKNRSNSL